MSFEKLVRPYQTRDITPPKIVATQKGGSSSSDPVVVTFGKSWSVKTLNGSETIDVSYYMEKMMREQTKDQQQQGG